MGCVDLKPAGKHGQVDCGHLGTLEMDDQVRKVSMDESQIRELRSLLASVLSS
jgi:hypothetical protein